MENIRKFVNQIKKKRNTGQATELTHRTALEELIWEVSGRKLMVLGEARNQLKAGKPDVIVQEGDDIIIGCIETKDIGKPLDKTDYEEQFERYKKKIHNLIITNYLDWELYKDKKLEDSVSIGTLSKDGTKIKVHKENFGKLLLMLQEFTGHKGLRITSSKNLAAIMANRAKGLKEKILNSLENNNERSSGLLNKQFELFKKHIMRGLDKSSFADMYAQTITYGLFVSWLNNENPEPFSRDGAIDGVSTNIPFLRGLFKIITDKDDIDPRINKDIDRLIDVFRLADREQLFSVSDRKDLFIHFYEDFLREYDEEVKLDRGVFYTPTEVVKYIVGAVDEILQTEFKLADGLADTSTVSYKYVVKDSVTEQLKRLEKKVDRVQILDPATGTGTFLVEVVRKVHERIKKQRRSWSGYVEEHLLENLHGFELLMTPYVMCHLKLNTVLKETGCDFKVGKRYNICLTNSLEQTIDSELYFDWLEEEAKLAKHIKDYRPINVVIGNPPYSVSSHNRSDFITKLLDVYKEGLNEQNKRHLSDDYIKFIRLSEDFIERNRYGIVAFITNNAFLGRVTHRQMRKHLLETFDKIYVINLHGKLKEKTPEGAKDENVFNITRGVSINIFVKTSADRSLAKVYYKDVYGTRESKYNWLAANNKISQTDFVELDPKGEYYFFVPRDVSSIEEGYMKGFGVNDLFNVNTSGVTTADDGRFVSYSPFASRKNKKYFYRPFDVRHINYDTGKGKLERARPDMRHFLEGENIGLCVCRQQSVFDFRHVFVTSGLADIAYLSSESSENTYVFPLYLYDVNCKNTNFNEKTLHAIEGKTNMKLGEDFEPEDLFDYVYGILHSNKYSDKYKEMLQIDFPRISYPESKEYFLKIAGYGKRLKEIHLHPESCPSSIEVGCSGVDNVITAIKFKDNKVYINKTQCFDNVPESAWNFYVGGHRPLHRWLQQRKNDKYTLTYNDITHYIKMVNAIAETIRIMDEIDRVIQV